METIDYMEHKGQKYVTLSKFVEIQNKLKFTKELHDRISELFDKSQNDLRASRSQAATHSENYSCMVAERNILDAKLKWEMKRFDSIIDKMITRMNQ